MSTSVLFSTIGVDEAEAFAHKLVEDRVVACVNVLPNAVSIYRWQGEVKREREAALIMEIWAADEAGRARAISEVAQRHPYDVPKIVALEAGGIWPAYEAWVRESTNSG